MTRDRLVATTYRIIQDGTRMQTTDAATADRLSRQGARVTASTHRVLADGGEETVKACRECDSATLYRRNLMSAHSPFGPEDPEWLCRDCGHEMHSPKRREKRYRGDVGGTVRRLLDAGKDIRADGGMEERINGGESR